ncbi:MAG: PQQ-dependent dehydrogenase, methanol/ethanol family [Sphingomonadales bacterium]|nr:PQQ-dependent dehydrogenase, methanol/ethanol family [Sphingomonadales bacterium]
MMRGLVGLMAVVPGAVAMAGLPGTGADWPGHGGGADESNYSRLAQVNRASVKRLGLAWALDLPGEVALEATPLAVGGVLYFTGSTSKVYAVEARTGRLLWVHDPEVWRHPAKVKIVFAVNRGAAYADGTVFAGTLDGRLQALDARTGKLKWSRETVAADDLHTSTGAPRAFGGLVVIGNGGADYGQRGYVTAYDQRTGRQVWRFYTVPGSPAQNRGDAAMEAAAKTWGPDFWKKTGGGGTVWNGMLFDPARGRLTIGTGNSGPWDPELRDPGSKGDNLYLASLVTLDAATGRYRWHYQVNPREAWDFKATANIVAGTVPVGGKPRAVLMQAPTNGFFYVIDQATGKFLSAGKIGKVNWASGIDPKTGRPVEMPGIRYESAGSGEVTLWPSPEGAHNWQDMAWSPQTGLAYVPVMQIGAKWTRHPAPGAISFNGTAQSSVIADEHDGKGELVAWDPVAQAARWRVPQRFFWNGGVLATAGGLVFQGAADGWLTGYDARSGKALWRFDAGLGIVAPPITYSVGGVQYLSVLVGYGGNTYGEGILFAGWHYGDQPRRLLTFRLGGTARLPKGAPQDLTVRAVDDAAFMIDPGKLEQGRTLFTWNCALCHGINAVSAGAPAPDLRESRVALSAEATWAVVHDGALERLGMPRFETLGREELELVRMYVRSRARAALAGEKR